MSTEKWIVQRRNELLAHTSDAEKAAYANLRMLGYDVVRQYPIQTGRRTYFADLYVPSLRCIVEIDGGYHGTRTQHRKDTNRSQGLWRMGFHVLRLNNKDARSIEAVRSKMRLVSR